MEVDFQLLATIHRTLRQETDLNERITKGPRRIKVAANAQAEAEKILASENQRLADTKKASTSKQRQLEERESHIEKLSAQRNGCANNKEYQLLTDQIAADKQANSVLEDEILELLGRADEIEKVILDLQKKVDQATTETQRVKDEVDAQLRQLNNDYERVNLERIELEKSLPIDIRGDYKRMVSSAGESTLAVVEDANCGNCFSMLQPRVLDALRQSKGVRCTSCSAFLYLPENRSISTPTNS